MPDAARQDELARSHLGLVHACCKRFSGKGVEYEELYSAGCLGLSKALKNFDESRGLRFSTYAFPVIVGEIKRLFRDGGTVKVSRSLRELSMKIARLNNESRLESGSELTVSQLAERLSVTPEEISEAISAARIPVSLSSEDGECGALELPAPDIQYEISERLTLRGAIDTLEEKDRGLINLRYYLGKTQCETARSLGMTQVQVSRREKKLLALLREKLK